MKEMTPRNIRLVITTLLPVGDVTSCLNMTCYESLQFRTCYEQATASQIDSVAKTSI